MLIGFFLFITTEMNRQTHRSDKDILSRLSFVLENVKLSFCTLPI